MVGLGIALFAGSLRLFFGDAFFTGQWLFLGATDDRTTRACRSRTVLVFDIGVYLVVFGSILTLVFALEEEV